MHKTLQDGSLYTSEPWFISATWNW